MESRNRRPSCHRRQTFANRGSPHPSRLAADSCSHAQDTLNSLLVVCTGNLPAPATRQRRQRRQHQACIYHVWSSPLRRSHWQDDGPSEKQVSRQQSVALSTTPPSALPEWPVACMSSSSHVVRPRSGWSLRRHRRKYQGRTVPLVECGWSILNTVNGHVPESNPIRQRTPSLSLVTCPMAPGLGI